MTINVIGTVAILSHHNSFLDHNNLTSIENNQNILEICCTWDDSLNDSILTFYIKNNQKENIIKNSFEEWNSKLSNVKFIENSDQSNVDIFVVLHNSDEKTVGQTISFLDDNGFIK